MKQSIFLFFTLFFSQFLHSQSGSNTVQGKINFQLHANSVVGRGTTYSPAQSSISKEKMQLDAANDPKNNIYISLHPTDFRPVMKTIDAQITQREQTFFPNVVALTVGSSVYFLNEDDCFHNIYSLSPKARFNIGRRPPGNVYGKKIEKVGTIKLGCDIHAHMSATIISYDTPYFVKVNENGSFQIQHLPDGNYEIRAFHPSFEPYMSKLRCQGGQIVTHNFNLSEK